MTQDCQLQLKACNWISGDVPSAREQVTTARANLTNATLPCFGTVKEDAARGSCNIRKMIGLSLQSPAYASGTYIFAIIEQDRVLDYQVISHHKIFPQNDNGERSHFGVRFSSVGC